MKAIRRFFNLTKIEELNDSLDTYRERNKQLEMAQQAVFAAQQAGQARADYACQLFGGLV